MRTTRKVAAIAAAAVVAGAVGAFAFTTSRSPRDVVVSTGAKVDAGVTAQVPFHVDGKYSGPSDFAITTERCATVDTMWNAQFQLSTGDVWQYHNDYCGSLVAGLFSAEGTFTFTLPDGDMITGTSRTTDVPVPGPGGPIRLTVTGGTGAFQAATGSCDLDNRVNDLDFGHQEQHGTFTCDLTTAEPTTETSTTSTSTSTTTSTVPGLSIPSPEWNGTLILMADGSVVAEGFESWLSTHPQPTPEDAARRLFSTTEGQASTVVDGPTATVSLLIPVIGDDSVAAVRYSATFQLSEGAAASLARATWAQQCNRGTDTTDFSPNACP